MRSSMQLRDDPANNTTAAGKGFLAASSILDYLGNSLLPRWPEQDGVPRPCETDARINTALSSYYQASAQKCAVVKGIYYKAGDPTPPGTLAKLSSAVSSLAGVALEAFFNLPTAKQNKVNQLMLAEMNYVRDVYAALTCYYEGCNQLSKEQCGIAIGFFKMAQTHLRQKDGANYFPFPPGLPKLIGPFASAAAGVTKLSILIQRSIDKADKDNRMIYFLSIPPVNEMPPLPSPAIIMTKPAFEEPRKGGHDFVSFHVPIVANSGLTVPMHEPVGGWGAPSTPHSALTNAFATLSTNPTAPPMTAPGNGCPRGRSDSAYARELQARFDAGHET